MKRMILALFILILFFVAVSLSIGWGLSTRKYEGPATDHFDGKRFRNPGSVEAKKFADVMKWMIDREKGEWKEVVDTAPGNPPIAELDEGRIRITFINHSSMLIQAGGVNILTDPIWSLRASPFQWIGPKRMRPPGIRFEDLPEIHLTLISHNHYDHLDANTVRALEEKFRPLFIVPLGVSDYLKKIGVANTRELDWHEKRRFSENLEIISTPAIHFSGRGLMDRDASLWCGFVLKTPAGSVYFAGDTGYGDVFKEIGEKYGPFAAAILPIGAYKPQWFMSPIHVSPEEAARIHLDIKSEKSIAAHFGCFPLADEGMDEAGEDLEKAKSKYGLENDFVVLKEGDYIDIR